jgi:hypothetical protein
LTDNLRSPNRSEKGDNENLPVLSEKKKKQIISKQNGFRAVVVNEASIVEEQQCDSL